MAATVTELGARVLRRLGVAAVAASDRPAVASTTTVADVAARALQRLAVTVPEASRPTNTAVVTATDITNRALQALGMLVPFSEWPTLTAVASITDIATDALQRLGVIAADQSPSTEDAALAAAHVRSIHERLIVNGYVHWIESAIPRAWQDTYAALTAIQLAPAFGKPADPTRQAQLEQFFRIGQAATRGTNSGTSRVAAFHSELVAIGAASWDVTAIPQAVAEDYEAIIRADLAPLFNLPVPPVDRAVIEERIRRVARVLRAQSDAVVTVTAVHDGLVRRGLVSWASSAIPAGLREPLSALVAIELASGFGVEADRGAVAEYETQVRQVALLIGGPTIAERAVRQVHADLEARGKTRWNWVDLPEAAERPYVVLAANSIAYEFQVQPDVVGGAQAVVDLARLISLPSSGERVVAEYF
jgi:hypothetical protein